MSLLYSVFVVLFLVLIFIVLPGLRIVQQYQKGGGIHINGIENFWSFTKRRLAKFNGVKKHFDLHL